MSGVLVVGRDPDNKVNVLYGGWQGDLIVTGKIYGAVPTTTVPDS